MISRHPPIVIKPQTDGSVWSVIRPRRVTVINSDLYINPPMSSISSVGSSSNNAAAIYQENLARSLAQKQAANAAAKAPVTATPAPVADPDHDGDSK